MVYVILEYEQDETMQQTFKDQDTHPITYSELEALEYVRKHEIYGKIEEYEREEYENYWYGLSDEVPDPTKVIEW